MENGDITPVVVEAPLRRSAYKAFGARDGAETSTETPSSSARAPAGGIFARLRQVAECVRTWFGVLMTCMRYAVGDEDTERTELPEWLQRFVLWYEKRGGRARVAAVLAAVAVVALLVVLYVIGVTAYGFLQRGASPATSALLSNNVHRFSSRNIRVNEFARPDQVDHSFLCECTPVHLNGRTPLRRIPLITEAQRELREQGGTAQLSLGEMEASAVPSVFVPYENVFWVNEQLITRQRSADGAEHGYMMPKMWNLTESPLDAEFVRSLGGEFNPCILTVRRGMTLLHMVNPIIVPSSEGDQATLAVRHNPAPFAPFMQRDSGDALKSTVREKYELRFYEWPDMDPVRVWNMVPETNKPVFRILVQLAIAALHTGFASELEEHGPFRGFEPLDGGASLSVEGETRTRTEERMWIAGEETIADTDSGARYMYVGDNETPEVAVQEPEYTESEVLVGGDGVYVRRVVNGKLVYVLSSSVEGVDEVARDEL